MVRHPPNPSYIWGQDGAAGLSAYRGHEIWVAAVAGLLAHLSLFWKKNHHWVCIFGTRLVPTVRYSANAR
jgi:hypothetical protein